MLLATLLNLPALTNALATPIRTLLQPDRAASAPLVGRQEFPEGACDPSHYRTFFNLLWTCATTILVFSWRSIHSNVPHPPATGLLTNKWITTLCGILAPEFVWVWASKERIIANRIEKEVSDRSPDGYPWTLAHSFFLVMGGFMVDVGDSYEVLVYDPVAGALRTINGLPVMLPKISEEELQDLSKADAFAKFLVFLQITGFVLLV
ncbi:hypothetical protein AX16_007892 [Volvariella volvacea WC 439]|nr:hypothetical protein AX16_007892 [Volvariella volvacea WC 439]